VKLFTKSFEKKLRKSNEKKVKVKFRYGGFDGRVWWTSIVTTLLFGGLCAWLFATADGAYYLAAWTTMTGVTLGVLCLLSTPWRIVLSDEVLELRCLLDVSYISLHSVVDVEVLDEERLGRRVPLVGCYGFWGYYGRFLDLRTRKVCRVYATRRKGCVAIHTSRRRYVVSCRTPEMLRSMILNAKSRTSRER